MEVIERIMRMKLSEYAKYDGLGLAELIREKKVSPKELLGTVREAVGVVNRRVNAVVDVYADQLEKAEKTKSYPGPFFGVPFMLKDISQTEKGRPCESGSLLGKGFIAHEDSFLTKRYRRAGLILFGRTASAEMGFSMTTETSLHGVTRNPWDVEKIAGGSSGGAAAAVASGILPMAHGNDAGGSIRIPAACCGLFGLKPSRGRISNGPAMGDVLMGFATEHALTLSVRDSAALLDISHGYEPGDPYIIQRPEKPYLEEVKTPTGKLRIAFSSKPLSGVAVDQEIIQALEKGAKLCQELGHEVIEAAPELSVDYDTFNDACIVVYTAGFAGFAQSLSESTGRKLSKEFLPHVILSTLEEASKLTASDLGRAMAVFNQCSRSIGRFFEQFDLFLTPTLASTAIPVGSLNMDDKSLSPKDWHNLSTAFGPFTVVWNVTGQPAMTVPLYESRDRLPIGIHFAAKFGDEATLFRLAGQLEKAQPWVDRRARVHVFDSNS